MFNLPENFNINWKIIQQKIKSNHLFVAVSGGVDSMVLTNLLIQNQIKFTILHCNFQLRGQESNGDEDFIIQFSTQNNIPYFVKKINIKNEGEVVNGIQEKARTLRYQWFQEIMNNYDNAFLLTAHHKNDAIETFLHNLFRGTGINGLSGIDEINYTQKIIRPLIHFYKEAILHYALEKNIIFREDSSNKKTDYTRNLFRNELIPAIKKIFPTVENNISTTIQHLQEASLFNNHILNEHWKKIIVNNPDGYKQIPILKWLQLTPFNLYTIYLIQQYGFNAHQAVAFKKLLQSNNSAFIESDSYRFIIDRKWVLIQKKETLNERFFLVENIQQIITFYNAKIIFECIENGSFLDNKNEQIAYLDAEKIKFPLIIRSVKVGDYFYPLGMNKKKKVHKFLKDIKLSLIEKEKTFILEMDKKIIWVLGKRIDNRFKVIDSTKKILKITIC